MENMSFEILDAIRDCFNDNNDESNELIATVCHYLYHTTVDDKMKQGCVEIMNDLEYCITCNTKLISYPYQEYHGEINEYENLCAVVCPICDKSDIER